MNNPASVMKGFFSLKKKSTAPNISDEKKKKNAIEHVKFLFKAAIDL